MSTPLRKWAIGGVMIATISLGLTTFIAGGMNITGYQGNVTSGELSELQQLQESSQITQTAQERSESVEARSEFFSLPGVVNTLRTVFQSIPIWEKMISATIEVFGLQYASQNWPQILAVSILFITISYRFAKVIR